ncbi:MAG: cobalamin transport system substrate-binding protein [Actinomycetota bacterium]|nr:cobalamin transport system substrate-binding protein [Actinomycetota bacterium]
MSRTRRAIGLTALAAVILAGACGSNNDKQAASTTTAAANVPERIVSLSATGTEMLFAIGAGKQVVAVDDQSNYPPTAPKTSLSGFKPNVEAIANYKPDLVVLTDSATEIKGGLEALGAKVFVQPAAKTLDDAYAQLRQLGTVTGHVDQADTVATKMKSDLTKLKASLPTNARGLTYYHELDNTYFSATSSTFIGSVYSLLGLKNIADTADKQGTGYPQLSAEYVLQANPDLVFLADTKCCQQSAATVAQRPGWSNMKAVKNGGVVELDDDIASRWGPRIVDYVRVVAAKIRKLPAKAAA